MENVARHEEVKGATGGFESAKGKYENAQAQLSYAQIYSPIAGIVADRSVFPGEMAVPGMPLLTIMDISSVIARVNVPQTQTNYVHVGQPARILAADGSEAAGTVTVVSPALDPQGTTVEVWVQAANPGEKLRPGRHGARHHQRGGRAQRRGGACRPRCCPLLKAARPCSQWVAT